MTRSPTKRFWRWGMGLLILVLGAAALAPTPKAGAQQPDGSCGTVTLKLDQNDVEFSFHAYFEEGENCSGGYVEAWAGPGDPEQPLEMEVRFDLDAGTMTGAVSGECHWVHQKEGVSDSLDAEFFGQISGRVEPGVPEGLVDTFWVFDGWLDLTMEIRATDMCRECTEGDDGSETCETFSDSYRGSFQVRAPITGNASPLAEFTAFFEDPYASGSSPGPATLDLWVLTEHWEAILGGENNSPILKKAFPSWPEIPCGKWGSGSSDNTPPEVKALDFDPLDPTSSDRIVFTAKATDPDGDELSYQWAIDGQVREKATKANLRWRSPPPGEHLVSVTVSDGRGGSDTAKVWVFVTEGDARPDRDEDGVCDDDDLCPDEFGLNADGCPDLVVLLGCQPIAPTLEDSVDCTAALGGARQGETFEFHWYRNSTYVATTEVPSWSFGPLETGYQYIAVQAVGEGRSADAELTLEVGEPQPLKVSLSHFPDPALEGSSVFFAATVSGGRDGQRPAFSWRLDGSDVGGDSDSWTWTEAQLGQHAVSVFVEQGEEMASASVEFLVLDAIVIPNNASITEAGFDVALDCYQQLYSDETLECTARLDRLQDRVVLLDVWWIVDGATAKMGSTVGARDSWSLGTPPPGTHDITVVVSDPLTGLSRSDSAGVVVQEAAGVVPPTVTAGAAGGTTLIFISWLWGEHILNKRATETAARRRPPSWVDDKRPLREIWREEAEAEMARRGLDPSEVYYDAERDCFVERKVYDKILRALEKKVQVIDLGSRFRHLVDEYNRLETEWNITRGCAFTDAFIEVWDLFFTVTGRFSTSTFSQAYAKEYIKKFTKKQARRVVRYGFTGEPFEDATEESWQMITDAIEAAGPNPDTVLRTYREKGLWRALVAARPSGASKQPLEVLAESRGFPLLGEGYSLAEDYVSASVDLLEGMDECDYLRWRMRQVHKKILETEHQLDDAMFEFGHALRESRS